MVALLLSGWGTAHGAEPRLAALLEDPLERPRFEAVGGNGIPRNVVASLAQDRSGFIWIGTGNGLVRYDGHRFRPVERESSDPTQRNLGWVKVMLAGRDGRMWIGTEQDGLAMHDPRDGQVLLFRGGGAHDAPAPTILALAEDRLGGIWVGGLGGGLARFDPVTRRFTTHRQRPVAGGLPDDRIGALMIDREGDLWIGSWNGLARHRPGSEGFEPVALDDQARSGDAAPNVVALHQATDGRIWIGLADGGLAVIDPISLQVRQLDRRLEADPAPRAAIRAFVEAPGRTMWAGSSAGIELYGVADGRLQQRLRHHLRDRTGLSADEVTSLLLDRAGMIWVGGLGLGLQRHDPDHRGVRVRGPDLRPGGLLPTVDVRSLLQLDDGSILASARHVGIVALDRRLRSTGMLLAHQRLGELARGATEPDEAMIQRADGSIWFGTTAAVVRFDAGTRTPQLWPHDAGATHDLHESLDGALWIATQDGLQVLRPGTRQFERILLRDGAVLTGPVYKVAEAADGRLWIGSSRGLFTLDTAVGARLHEVDAERAVDGLANSVVVGLLIGRDGTLWIDTAVAGLHRMLSFDGRHARFERISERHGVVNRPFGANLLQDGRGRIWTHMHVYDPALDRLHELTAADGVDIGTGWFGSALKTADGRLLFGGSAGVLVVEPERFDVSDYEPPLVVSELRIDKIPQPSQQVGSGLRIGPGQRSFSVEFVALDYTDPQRTRYAHRLDGFDADWVESGSDFRIASYGNLDPGDYLLRVRAGDRSGVWNEDELSIPVRVEPAWWQHPGLRLLGLLVLLALLVALERWRTRALRRGKLALEHKVEQRTAELQRVAAALQQESAARDEASMTDSLSGLRNRRFVMRFIEDDTRLVVRRHEGHAGLDRLPEDADLIFFLLDIDHFKQINDQHGHAAGDAVIGQMRERLERVFRDTDYLVRWGGEEFLIVARATSRAHAASLAERVLNAVATQPFALDDGSFLYKTCSIGFSCFPLSPQHPRALDWAASVDTADAALYAVKRAGRNGWLGLVRAHADTSDELIARARQPLDQWLASGQLEMAVSPRHANWSGRSEAV